MSNEEKQFRYFRAYPSGQDIGAFVENKDEFIQKLKDAVNKSPELFFRIEDLGKMNRG